MGCIGRDTILLRIILQFSLSVLAKIEDVCCDSVAMLLETFAQAGPKMSSEKRRFMVADDSS